MSVFGLHNFFKSLVSCGFEKGLGHFFLFFQTLFNSETLIVRKYISALFPHNWSGQFVQYGFLGADTIQPSWWHKHCLRIWRDPAVLMTQALSPPGDFLWRQLHKSRKTQLWVSIRNGRNKNIVFKIRDSSFLDFFCRHKKIDNAVCHSFYSMS